MITIHSLQHWDDIYAASYNDLKNVIVPDDIIKTHQSALNIIEILRQTKISNDIIFWLANNQQAFFGIFHNAHLSRNEYVKFMFSCLFQNTHFNPDNRLIKHFNLPQIQIDLVKMNKNYINYIKYMFPETKDYIRLLFL